MSSLANMRNVEEVASPFQHLSPVENERQRALEELEKLYVEVYKWKAAINSFSPTSKLPVELLSEIFLLVKESLEHDQKSSTSWIVITSVCQHWRSVALRTPFLWTEIHPFGVEQVNFQIQRSGTLPLSLIVPIAVRANPKAIHDALVNHANRFSTINMSLPITWNTLSGDLGNQTFSLLKNLLLSVSQRLLPLGTGRAYAFVPQMFKKCQFPALENLCLSYYVLFQPIPLIAPTLRTLTIHQTKGPLVQFLLLSLSKTPNLSYLSVQGDFSEYASQTIEPPVYPNLRVSLPRLKYLLLAPTSDPSGMFSLLNRITFPSQATFVTSSCSPTLGGTMGAPDMFARGLRPTLRGDNRIGPTPKYRTCTFDLQHMIVGLWNDLYPTQHDEEVDHVRIARACTGTQDGFFIRAPFSPIGENPTIQDMFNIVRLCPLEDVESVLLNDAWGPRWCFEPGKVPDWHLILSQMSKISRMQIRTHVRESQTYYQSFLSKVLLPFENSIAPTTPPTPFLPLLKTLVVYNVPFRDGWNRALVEALERRKSKGVPIERLVLEECDGVGKKKVQRLLKAVGEVVQVRCRTHFPKPPPTAGPSGM